MATENSKLSDQYYQKRDGLMLKNEGIVQNIYLDTIGIPTVGIGVALIYVNRKNATATVDTQRVNKIAEYAHLSNPEKEQLMGLLQEQANNLKNNPPPDYRNKRRTLSNFRSTPLGRASEKTFGTINGGGHWNILTDEQDKMQINFSTEQVNEFYKEITAPEYEEKLDNILEKKGVPKEAISEEQRAALFSLTYHGGQNLEKNRHLRLAIDAIKDYSEGRIKEEQFESRIEKIFGHVKGQFHSRRKGEGELLMHVKPPKPRVQKHSSLDPNHNLDNFAHQTQVANAQLSPAAKKLAEQCEERLIDFCKRNNISASDPDDYKNIAMALTAKGIEARMSRVESVNVDLNENSVTIFSHEPDLRYAEMQLDTATKTPAHESTLQVAQAENTLAREQAEQQFNQNQSKGRSIG